LVELSAGRLPAAGFREARPASANTKQAQQLVVLLPDKSIATFIGDPYAGSYFYHSGAGNDLDNSMTRSVALGAGPITHAFQARYQIETCWDYAYVEISINGGTMFSSIPTSASRLRLDAGRQVLVDLVLLRRADLVRCDSRTLLDR
jgi:bacillopeptidase F (M6 metalloprotease family)